MKVVIFKNYSKSTSVICNYGDDYEDVWHNFNAIESVKEITEEDFEVLKRAINYFNSKGNRNYTIGYFVVIKDEEVECLLNDYKLFEKKESEKAEKLRRAKMEKELAVKAKSEEKKHERLVKKFAKELNLSEDEVRIMLANKK